MSSHKVRIAVPTIVAVLGVLLLLRASGVPFGTEHVVEVGGGPTPYSFDHERVQSRPGPAEEMPPTF